MEPPGRIKIMIRLEESDAGVGAWAGLGPLYSRAPRSYRPTTLVGRQPLLSVISALLQSSQNLSMSRRGGGHILGTFPGHASHFSQAALIPSSPGLILKVCKSALKHNTDTHRDPTLRE